MKIGILTFHWAYNYGAVLQAYALQKSLEKMGHHVEILNFQPKAIKPPWYQKYPKSSSFMKAMFMFRKFDNFVKRRLILSPLFKNKDEMLEYCKCFDAVITGSDQVWNQNITKEYWKIYYLEFLNNSRIQKISFAASMGELIRNEYYHDREVKKLLSDYSFITVRDNITADYLNSINVDCQLVDDPTILWDFNELFDDKVEKNNALLIYALNKKKAIELLKSLDITMLKTSYSMWPSYNLGNISTFPGPIEWIRLIRGSKLLISDSFHAVVFGIKYGIQIMPFAGYRPERVRYFLKKIDTKLVLNDKGEYTKGELKIFETKQYSSNIHKKQQEGIRILETVLKGKSMDHMR